MGKKIIIIIIVFIILILAGVGIFVWEDQYQKAVNFCEEECVYFSGWRHSTYNLSWPLTFETKKECIINCLDGNYYFRAFKR